MLDFFFDKRGLNPRRRDTWSLRARPARRRKKKQHEKKTTERRDTPLSLLPHAFDSSFRRRIRQTSLRRGYGLAGQPSLGLVEAAVSPAHLILRRSGFAKLQHDSCCSGRIPILHPSIACARLRLVAKTLLMATLLHALMALVLCNFRFASFFEGAHSVFQICEPDSTI